VADVLEGNQFITEDLAALQADFEHDVMSSRYAPGMPVLAEVLKRHDKEIEEAERRVREQQRKREEPLKQYEQKMADFAATLPGKDPFYAASFYMDGRFDGTWGSHSRNSGNMLEYWHERGMLLAGLNALLLRDVQPVFMLDVATSEMGSERSHPLTRDSRNRGLLKNQFAAVIGHTSPESPMEIVDTVELDHTTGARTLRPSKVMLNVEIDDLIISDNWPTQNMGGRKPKAGVRTIDERGVLQVPILEAPFPSIGGSANNALVTELGNTNIFGTTSVAVGAGRAAQLLLRQQEQYIDGVRHDEPTWDSISTAIRMP
jgi:hypothetical protein